MVRKIKTQTIYVIEYCNTTHSTRWKPMGLEYYLSRVTARENMRRMKATDVLPDGMIREYRIAEYNFNKAV